MRHRLQLFIHLRAHGRDKEMSTLLTLSCGVWPIYLFTLLQYSAPDRGAECDDHVCVFVCPQVYLQKCTPVLPMAVARSSSGSVAIFYVLPVLYMTSYVILAHK